MTPSQFEAAKKIRAWRHDPVKFVRDVFRVEPDPWQADGLLYVGGETNPRRRLGMKACTGPGKSTELAWIGWHRLLCFGEQGEHPKGAALSGEGRDNLMDNLWAELSKWQSRSELLKATFNWNKERISSKDHPETWFLSARSYAKDANVEAIGSAMSGLHSRFPFLLLDEIGQMPLTVGQKATQIFTGGVVDGLIAAAGNPTSTTGLLYQIAVHEAHLWNIITITADPDDPKRTPRVDIDHAREQIKAYGRTNPWVMATILGLFPESGFNTLLTLAEVEASMGRRAEGDAVTNAQKRLGIDVSRFGDDRTVIFPRQGLIAYKPVIMRGARTPEIAARVALAKNKWGSELEMVDGTGGFGAGVIDSLLQAGFNPLEIHFSGKAIDSRYANKRAEMWFLMADWIKGRGALPNDPELKRELTAPTYTFSNGKFLLEPKEAIKKRLGYSPDCFVSGTMVRTPKGLCPIETIKEGDLVSTPMGPRKVLRNWKSQTTLLTAVKFSNGSVLVGKGPHEIFTWNYGWVALDRLTPSHELEIDSVSRRARWFLRRSFTTARHSSFKRLVGIISHEGKMVRSDFFIAKYGASLLETFRSGITFIIVMATGKTIALRTSNLSMAVSIFPDICESTFKILNSEKRHWLAFIKHSLLPLIGTRAQKEVRGIGPTQSAHGEKEPQHPPHVRVAGRISKHTSNLGLDFVRTHVSKRLGFSATKQKLGLAFSVGRRLFSISTGRNPVVPVSVQTGDVPDTQVYNLTLDRDNIYYANGILVANCADALALTFAIAEAPGRESYQAKAEAMGLGSNNRVVSDWDPFAERK